MEPHTEKEAEVSLRKTSARRKEESKSSSSSSEGSSFQELLSASDLLSARGRISREIRCQSFQGEGQALESILTRQLSTHLDKLELIPRDKERVSVITRTPSRSPPRSPKTSTPSTFPPPPQNLGPIILPGYRSHSPSGSDISSINGDVFSEPDNLELSSRISLAHAAPGTPLQIPVIKITSTMEAAEKDIKLKDKKVHYRMRTFDPSAINDECRPSRCTHICKSVPKSRNNSLQVIINSDH